MYILYFRSCKPIKLSLCRKTCLDKTITLLALIESLPLCLVGSIGDYTRYFESNCLKQITNRNQLLFRLVTAIKLSSNQQLYPLSLYV